MNQQSNMKWYLQQKQSFQVREKLYGYTQQLQELSVINSTKFGLPTEYVGCINDQDQKEVIKMLKFTHLKWCAKSNCFALGYNKINNQKRQGHLSIFDMNDWKLFYKKFSNDEAMIGILSQDYLNKIFGIGSNGGIYSIEKGIGGLEQRPIAEAKIQGITEACFSPNHYKISFSSQDKLIYIYDVITEQKDIMQGHGKEIYTQQWNPTNSLILSGSDDETIRIWDSSTKDEIINLKRHNLGVKKVRWNQNGNYFLTTGKDKQTMLFDLRKLDNEIYRFPQNQLETLLWHPKYNNIFLTGDVNGTIYGYNIHCPTEAMYMSTMPETIVSDIALDNTGQIMSIIRAKQPVPEMKINASDNISIYRLSQ